jgi:hypothetical protein
MFQKDSCSFDLIHVSLKVKTSHEKNEFQSSKLRIFRANRERDSDMSIKEVP